ncbi:MAG: hypothetical protein CVV33_09910, partial [Methanomicrobiales archaeon HGW-Methanomicrobiales-4]
MNISRYHLFLILLCCVCTAFFAGCTGVENQNGTSLQTEQNVENQSGTGTTGLLWMTIPITDAITGKTTSISELVAQGKPVIIHTFAVWCPSCSIQLRETASMVKNNPDAYTVLGIDIDPRENTEMVKRHIEKNSFVGMYGAAPPEMTRDLMK